MASANDNLVGLRSDKQWKQLENELCRISGFMALGGEVKDGVVVSEQKDTPYAGFEIECRRIPTGNEVRGFCTQKNDFENLWEVFKERDQASDEEVLIIWTKQHYNRAMFKMLSLMAPKMIVMVCPSGTYDRVTDHTWRKGESLSDVLSKYDPASCYVPDPMRSSKQPFRG